MYRTIGLAILFLFSSIIYSQSSDSLALSLKKGKIALLFSVGSEFRLGSIDGAMFSCKIHLSDRAAIRIGAGMNLLDRKGKLTYSDHVTKPLESIRENYTANAYLVYYMLKRNIINPYFAFGPLFTYDRSYDEIEYSNRYRSNEYIERGFGGGILIGTEWFFIENMSLFGEYNPSINLSHYQEQRYEKDGKEIYTTFEEGNNVKITNSVRLGLGIYF